MKRNVRKREKVRGGSVRSPVRRVMAVLPRLLARLAIAAAVAGAVVGTWSWLTTSESLAIRSIVIEGTSPERAEEIRALLGLSEGDNLLFADLKQARAKAEQHPWVARCAVKRELPDTLRVVIEERDPQMLLSLERLYYVDGSGSPFKALQPGDAYDLPVLTGISREDWLERADVSGEAVRGALELLAAIRGGTSKEGLSPEEVSEIHWDPVEGYSVLTMGGTALPFMTIRFGVGSYEDKLTRLFRVREAEKSGSGGRDAVNTIDLTYASRVIVAR